MESKLIDFKKQLNDILTRLKEDTAPYMEKMPVVAAKMADIEKLYKEKIENTKPQIMFFGLYNAGKSSLLNELLRNDVAKVADVPTTDHVDYYNWRGYTIADTPGVGAPIEHEEVTNEAIRKADVVLFVMTNAGSFEKKENYVRMKDIVDAGKKVIIVINDKSDFLPQERYEEMMQVQQKIYDNMMALDIDNVKERFTILFVNAKLAHKGRMANKHLLWEKSQIAELESYILSEMKNSDDFAVIRHAIDEINKDVEAIREQLSQVDTNPEYMAIQKVLNGLHNAKIQVRKNMSDFISSQTNKLGCTLPDAIWAVKEDQAKIDQTVQQAQQNLSEKVKAHLEDQLQTVVDDLSMDWTNFVVEMQKLEAQRIRVDEPQVEAAQSTEIPEENTDFIKESMGAWAESKMDAETARTIASEGTQLLEGMMKGAGFKIGKGGIGKYFLKKTGLGAFLKSVPFIAKVPVPPLEIVILGYTALKHFLGDDGAYERARAQAERENAMAEAKAQAEEQARQALQQKCLYMVDDIKENLILWTNQVIRSHIGTYEDNLSGKMKTLMNDQTNALGVISHLAKISDDYDKLAIDMKGSK
ncbi:MAG: GTPase [Dialister sp.]|nr:GTPase [Dialister sp.]